MYGYRCYEVKVPQILLLLAILLFTLLLSSTATKYWHYIKQKICFFSSECDEYWALFAFLMDAFQHSEVLCYRQAVTCSAPSFGNQIWQLLLFAKSKYMHRKKVHIEIVLFYIGTVDNEYVLLLHHFISESVSVISSFFLSRPALDTVKSWFRPSSILV